MIDSIFEHAVSVNLPANWSPEDTKYFPAFILDIIPAVQAIFRYSERFDLIPIYDLAPMVLDAEGVTRATKWEAEKKGSPKWREICACFPQWYAPDYLYERIRGAANEFRALPDLLVDMPLNIRQSKAIPVNNLDSNYELWELL
ncbi:MAG TPA: hypothetical protein ENI17_06655 [Pseudomonas xinjiangensis]|uniref:Uncharacterized protein n=1 Tax=Halopseudomonas xinjiangensis TaxID=487184 RepID=A0A7V1BPB4_9GAMM|nr:hypothetical protein [Halopseudomonas xinjiangensis]HEC47293.1 hypothetical protein [Halopseudomonas xinjiangensis]